jgi:hypothetical protein
MIRRVFVAALAASIVLPGLAAAQTGLGAPYSPPQFRVTPFFGYMTAVDRQEEWTYQNGTTVQRTADVRVDGGPTLGVQVEAPLIGVIALNAAAGYSHRGTTTFVVDESGDIIGINGANVFFVRAGPAYHMPTEQSEFVLRRLGASVFGGVVAMHERMRNTNDNGFMGSGTHLGINAGLNAELPFAEDRFAFQLGAESNFMFWNRNYLARLPDAYEPGSQVTVTTRTSPTWLLRAGLSYRLR